jgi:hypothetical protein
MRHEILAAARTCDAVEVHRLAADLDAGTYRPVVFAHVAQARADNVSCSGTLLRADGTMPCNPATETAWIGGTFPRGTPIVVADDPAMFDRIVAESLVPAWS